MNLTLKFLYSPMIYLLVLSFYSCSGMSSEIYEAIWGDRNRGLEAVVSIGRGMGHGVVIVGTCIHMRMCNRKNHSLIRSIPSPCFAYRESAGGTMCDGTNMWHTVNAAAAMHDIASPPKILFSFCVRDRWKDYTLLCILYTYI